MQCLKPKKEKKKKNLKLAKKLDRDRCVICGDPNMLTTHHITSEGAGGDDSFDNLITLCFKCHRAVHDGIKVVSNNPPIMLLPEEKEFKSGKDLIYYWLKPMEKSKTFRFKKFIKNYEDENEI